MKASLKHLVLGALVLMTVAVITGFTVYTTVEDLEEDLARLEDTVSSLGKATAPVVLNALVVEDLATAEQSLQAINAGEIMDRVRLLAPDSGRVLVDASPRAPLPSRAPAWLKRALAIAPAELSVEVVGGGVSYGTIVLRPSTRMIENDAWAHIRRTMVEMLVLLAVLAVALERVLHFGLRPVLEISRVATRFGQGDYGARMRRSEVAETQRLAESFNAMAGNLERALAEVRAQEAANREALRSAELANRSKSEFLANISHELRTPLNAIIGFSSVVKEQMFGPVGTPKYQEYATAIHESGEHLLAIINDLLDVSAIEADRLELQIGACDLDRLTESTIRLVAPRAAAVGIELTRRVDMGEATVMADERRLKQIMLNLLSNAIKFTGRGGRVALTAEGDGKGGLVVVVSDTGIGMDEEGIATALERFGQVDGGLNRRREGAGLGLPLTKGLVELHRGTLAIDSAPGQGTTVTVTLPPAQALAPAIDRDQAKAA